MVACSGWTFLSLRGKAQVRFPYATIYFERYFMYFYCVHTFDAALGDFVIEGLFTMHADAVVFAKTFNENYNGASPDAVGGTSAANGGSVWITHQTRRAVIAMLLSERLDKMYEPLKILADKSPNQNPDYTNFPHVVCDPVTGQVVGRFNNEVDANFFIKGKINETR